MSYVINLPLTRLFLLLPLLLLLLLRCFFILYTSDTETENWKNQALPLGRIKKIMKSEEFAMQEIERKQRGEAAMKMLQDAANTAETSNVSNIDKKPSVAVAAANANGNANTNTTTSTSGGGSKFMISAEAPALMTKACELLVREIATRAWKHTDGHRRKTLQRADVHAAVGETEVFDFLIDIVPRVVVVAATTSTEAAATNHHSANINNNAFAASVAATTQTTTVSAANHSMLPAAGQQPAATIAAPPFAAAADGRMMMNAFIHASPAAVDINNSHDDDDDDDGDDGDDDNNSNHLPQLFNYENLQLPPLAQFADENEQHHQQPSIPQLQQQQWAADAGGGL